MTEKYKACATAEKIEYGDAIDFLNGIEKQDADTLIAEYLEEHGHNIINFDFLVLIALRVLLNRPQMKMSFSSSADTTRVKELEKALGDILECIFGCAAPCATEVRRIIMATKTKGCEDEY